MFQDYTFPYSFKTIPFTFDQIINQTTVNIIPHPHLALTNPLREFPLLVVAAFPPNPTTSAVIIALLPPAKTAKEKKHWFHSKPF